MSKSGHEKDQQQQVKNGKVLNPSVTKEQKSTNEDIDVIHKGNNLDEADASTMLDISQPAVTNTNTTAKNVGSWENGNHTKEREKQNQIVGSF